MKDTTFYKKHHLNCGGKLLDLSTPQIMGILNLTPDSFYDGGQNLTEFSLLKLAEQHLSHGALILDVGGQSTRPGAEMVSEKEELARILPSVRSLAKNFPEAILSLDTFYSTVAKVGVNEGIHIINDVSLGSFDPNLLPWVIDKKIPYIATHCANIDSNEEPIIAVCKGLSQIKNEFFQKGHSNLIVDPGFGFGKDLNQNLHLLQKIEQLQILDLPILIGISRKSMIFKTLKVSPQEALNGTTIANTIAIMKGANILRVHDVKQAKECIELVNAIQVG